MQIERESARMSPGPKAIRADPPCFGISWASAAARKMKLGAVAGAGAMAQLRVGARSNPNSAAAPAAAHSVSKVHP